MKGIVVIAALLVLLIGCAPGGLTESLTPSSMERPSSGEEATPTSEPALVPNPASKHCVDQGYELEIRTDEEGNQYGVCIFPDGSECEEWAFFRGECTYEGE